MQERWKYEKGVLSPMHDESLNATIEPIRRMLEHTGVKSVFGEPIGEGNVTVIPVAQANFLFGGGIGFYPERPPNVTGGEDACSGAGGVDGAGGGYVGRAKPRGYIRISADGSVEYEALVDPMRLTLRGMALSVGPVAILLGIMRAIRS